jgi:hypothetical protein
MTIQRSLLAVLATVACGVAAASAAVPTVDQSTAAVETSPSGIQLAANDDDLTWHFLHFSGRQPFGASTSGDWITRGDPGSQDDSVDYGSTASISSAQGENPSGPPEDDSNQDLDNQDQPPCFC